MSVPSSTATQVTVPPALQGPLEELKERAPAGGLDSQSFAQLPPDRQAEWQSLITAFQGFAQDAGVGPEETNRLLMEADIDASAINAASGPATISGPPEISTKHPLPIALLVDTSGSMSWLGYDGQTPQTHVRDALNSLLFGLLGANKSVRQGKTVIADRCQTSVFGFGYADASGREVLRAATGTRDRPFVGLRDLPSLLKNRDQLGPDSEAAPVFIDHELDGHGGATPMAQALRELTPVLKAQAEADPDAHPPIVFLITDGMPSEDTKGLNDGVDATIAAARALKEAVTTKHGPAQIFPIHISRGTTKSLRVSDALVGRVAATHIDYPGKRLIKGGTVLTEADVARLKTWEAGFVEVLAAPREEIFPAPVAEGGSRELRELLAQIASPMTSAQLEAAKAAGLVPETQEAAFLCVSNASAHKLLGILEFGTRDLRK